MPSKPIYQAVHAEAAEQSLDAFERGVWDKQYPTVVAAWRHAVTGLHTKK